jgi:hypothetical protein
MSVPEFGRAVMLPYMSMQGFDVHYATASESMKALRCRSQAHGPGWEGMDGYLILA